MDDVKQEIPSESDLNGATETTGEPPETSNSLAEKKERCQALSEKTGYSLTVSPSLRKYGGPPPDGSERPRGAEVFLGRLPKDMFEDELVPIVEQYGRIWEMRVLTDQEKGEGRGYAFVTFYTSREATEFIRALNNKPLPGRSDSRFSLSLSKPHSLVVVRNIPKDKTREILVEDFNKSFEGILNVIIWGVNAEVKPARLIAFMEFGSERAALNALHKLNSGEVRPYNNQLDAYYSFCDDTSNAHTMVLHLRNLPEDASEQNITEYFHQYEAFDRVRVINRFAFLHFRDHESAEKCLQEQYGQRFLGHPLELAWAKTKTYTPMPPEPRHPGESPPGRGGRGPPPRGPPGRDRPSGYGRPEQDYRRPPPMYGERRSPPPPPRGGGPPRYGREEYGSAPAYGSREPSYGSREPPAYGGGGSHREPPYARSNSYGGNRQEPYGGSRQDPYGGGRQDSYGGGRSDGRYAEEGRDLYRGPGSMQSTQRTPYEQSHPGEYGRYGESERQGPRTQYGAPSQEGYGGYGRREAASPSRYSGGGAGGYNPPPASARRPREDDYGNPDAVKRYRPNESGRGSGKPSRGSPRGGLRTSTSQPRQQNNGRSNSGHRTDFSSDNFSSSYGNGWEG